MKDKSKSRQELKKRRLRPKGGVEKATEAEMIAAVTATGSFTDAAKVLGIDDSTIHCRLKHLRGTPEWDKMVAETQPDITELRKKLADGLNELYARAVDELKSLSGIKFLTGYGILCDKYARLSGEAPVFNNSNAVQVFAVPSQEEKKSRFLRLEELEPPIGKPSDNGN